MEPTPGEYPSKMRVALVRRNPADGAAPLGLKKSVASPPALSLHASLSLTLRSLSLPSLRAPGGRSGPHAAGHERGPARDRTAGAEARSSRGQGSGPTAPTARQERTAPGRAGRGPAPTARQDRKPPAPPAGSFPGRRARAPAPPGSRSRGRKPPPFQRSSPSTGPSIVQGKSSVVSCRSMLDCSSLFMCERCLM